MTEKDLKNALLQEAMQGKLVPQIASEGNARDLLEEIRKEKAKLVKEGKLKKEKSLPELTEEEIPFDIPENWCWCRLGEIVYNNGQKTPDKEFSYIDIGSVDNEHQKLNEKENFIQPDKAPSRARKIVRFGDVIYSTVRPYLHNMCIIDKEFTKEPIASTGFAVMTSFPGLLNKYLFYYLLSPTFDNYANDTDNAKGVAYPAINDDKLYKGIVPLPPLAEQKRIVATIEKFMPLIEEYGKKETELKAFNEQIGTLTKKAILQEAVQGKLVPQIAAEGNAKDLLEEIKKEKAKLIKEGKIKKEKPLPEITEDEIPFDIPENWCWCRLGEITEITMGQSPEGINVGKTVQGMEFHQGKIFFTDKIIGKSNQQTSEITKVAKENSILLCMRAPVGKINITDREICIGRGLSSIIPFFNVDTIFLYYLLETLESDFNKKATGSTFKAITGDIVRNQAIPLPPLAEQKRIVVAIEKMLPLCEKLGE